MLKLFILIFSLFAASYTSAQTTTYNKHIAPIIYNKCASCHRPGQIAPMPFTNYEEAVAYASMIKFVTETKYMPPWQVSHSDFKFKNNRQLSEEEINLISEWVEGGAVEGEAPPIPFPDFDDEPIISDPDLEVGMLESFEQYGVYYDQFKVFVVPTGLTENKSVEAIEFRPGNPEILRSCFISIDTSDLSKPLDDWDPTYGYFSFGALGFVPLESRWFSWTVGQKAKFYNPYNKVIPKNAKLIFHIHYGPTHHPQKDSSVVLFKFAKKKNSKTLRSLPLINPYVMTNAAFEIPANEVIRYHAKWIVPFDLLLHGLLPHSHLLGQKWEIFTVHPETKTSQQLLKINNWDLKWKEQYDFEQPILLKKGTEVHALATYNNTSAHLTNPSDPPRKMNWGKRMFEEMFLAYFEISDVHHSDKITVSPIPTLITNNEVRFSFTPDVDQQLRLMINDFEGNISKEVKMLKQYPAFSKVDCQLILDDLPYGNYTLDFQDEQKNIVLQIPFIRVEPDFLGRK